jgi:hypothetical protein
MNSCRVSASLVSPSETELPAGHGSLMELEEAAWTIDQRLFVLKASNDTELAAAFAALLEQRAGALFVAADPYYAT